MVWYYLDVRPLVCAVYYDLYPVKNGWWFFIPKDRTMVGSRTSVRWPTIIYRNDGEMRLHKTVLQYAGRILKGPCSRQALSVKLIEVRLAVVRLEMVKYVRPKSSKDQPVWVVRDVAEFEGVRGRPELDSRPSRGRGNQSDRVVQLLVDVFPVQPAHGRKVGPRLVSQRVWNSVGC